MSLSLTPGTYRGSLGQLSTGVDREVIQQRGLGGSRIALLAGSSELLRKHRGGRRRRKEEYR